MSDKQSPSAMLAMIAMLGGNLPLTPFGNFKSRRRNYTPCLKCGKLTKNETCHECETKAKEQTK